MDEKGHAQSVSQVEASTGGRRSVSIVGKIPAVGEGVNDC